MKQKDNGDSAAAKLARKKAKQSIQITSNLPSVTYPTGHRGRSMKTKPQIYEQESYVPGMLGRKGTYIGDVNG